MKTKFICIIFFISLLTACTYNPFVTNNGLTGNPTSALVGAGIGAGGAALIGAPKSVIFWSGIGGGAVGYYVSTLRHDADGLIKGGGQVYRVGDYIGIYIPTDHLFEPNTADFIPEAGPILDSVSLILQRCPYNNILVSGNTSGFSFRGWELALSEKRAQRVAAYLWNTGIQSYTSQRKLNYVGYGDYFPIASDLTNTGIRQNSRIQITSYPSSFTLLPKPNVSFKNYAGLED